jgi:hypothetical protein
MIEKLSGSAGNFLAFKASGKLTDHDYKEMYVPALKAAVEAYGKVRIVFELADNFQGWDVHAAWDEIKLEPLYLTKIERAAFVGHERWEKWMAKLMKPFTTGEVRYFEANKGSDAWKWAAEK